MLLAIQVEIIMSANNIGELSSRTKFIIILFGMEVKLVSHPQSPLFSYSYSLIGIREHIKKRPPLASTEKVQQYVKVGYRLVFLLLILLISPGF